MKPADFEFIQNLAYQETGILLPEKKKHMVYSRLCRRLRHLRLTNFTQYCQLIQQDQRELINFVNALTTNLTAFFREDHHFDYLEDYVVPEWQLRRSKRLRIWSSACSTGEEPYSIAMTLAEHFSSPEWDLKILATDLDTNVLNKAAKGWYHDDKLTSLPQRYRAKYAQSADNGIQMKKILQSMIHFKRLNLLGSWPMSGQFDIIFCRNVLIYFDNETKAKIIARFRQQLASNGILIIGHSETLTNISEEFKLIGKTIYQPLGGDHPNMKASKQKAETCS